MGNDMTLEELYAQIDGDYEEALGRLRMEKLIGKFIVKYLDDQSGVQLISSWRAGDENGTFEAAHSAKGVCSNLSLNKLAAIASEITEALRPGNDALRAATDIDALVNSFEAAYDKTIESIKVYAAQQ